MNKKIIYVGIILFIIAALFLFSNKEQPINVTYQTSVLDRLTSGISSKGIIFQNITLLDSTTYNASTNTCVASRYGMNILITPCIAQDADGSNVQQYVNFTWQGNNPQNTSWIFVYDGQLASGRMDKWQNSSYQYIDYFTNQTWLSNFLLQNIVNYTNLGSPDSRCELGSQYNNTQMYSVTRQTNRTFSQVYCFTNVTAINATAFHLSGWIDVTQHNIITAYKNQWIDVTQAVQYMGHGLLQDNRSYYQVQNVTFQPSQTIATKWTYTSANAERRGKWHILGYDTQTGLINSIVNNAYIYIDPWWNNNWKFKKQISVQENTGATLTNYSTRINVTYNSNMNPDFSDLRFLDSSETAELPYWIESKANSNSALIWVKIPTLTASQNTSVYMYYGNSTAVSTTSDGKATFKMFDDFTEPSINTTLWSSSSNCITAGVCAVSNSNFTLYTNASNHGLNGLTNYPLKDFIVESRLWLSTGGTTSGQYFGRTRDSSFAVFNSPWGTGEWRIFDGTERSVAEGSLINKWFIAGHWENATAYRYYYNYNYNDTLSVSETNISAYIQYHTQGGNSIISDWVRARPMVDIEPTSTFGQEQTRTSVTTTLLTPSNATKTTSSQINFSANSSSTGNLQNFDNITLFVWNSTNSLILTNKTDLSNNVSIITNWSINFNDGDYYWNALTSGSSGSLLAWDTSNRTITIDGIAPSITLPSPSGDIGLKTSPYNITLNFTATDANIGTCYYNSTFNPTITIANCSTQTIISVSSLAPSQTIFVYANDTLGNLAMNSTSYIVSLELANNFTTPVYETSNQNFSMNMSYNSTYFTSASAILFYNNTAYTANTLGSGDNILFNYNLTIPSVSAQTNKSFYWQVTLNNGTTNSLYNSTFHNQTILQLSPAVSTTCSESAYTFTFADEENLSAISGVVDYNIQYGLSPDNLKTISGTLPSTLNFSICINSTQSPTWVIGSGEFHYSATNYVDRRFYIFDNTYVTNNTNNITLYDLLSSRQTSFQFIAEDNTLTPFVDKYVETLRWYPNLNTYSIVEMGKTDTQGSSVLHVRTEDIDYRMGLFYRNGTLIKLDEPTRMLCLQAPCTYTMRVSPSNTEYTNFENVQYSFDYNQTTHIWTFIYNDPSQTTHQMNLTIYKDTGDNSFVICGSSTTGYTGVVTCNTSQYSAGTLRGEVYRSASPPVPIAQLIVNAAVSVFQSGYGLWLSFLVGLPLIIVLAIVSPIAAIIGGVISLIPAFYAGAINIEILGGIAILGGIVAHFLKRVS